MSSITFSASKLMLIYYDFRNDVRLQSTPGNQGAFKFYIPDTVSPEPSIWHTVDVRAAQANPSDVPVFVSAPVSKYFYLLDKFGVPRQARANSLNYAMLVQG